MNMHDRWIICIIANILFAIHSIGIYENIQFAKVILSELNIMLSVYDKQFDYGQYWDSFCIQRKVFKRIVNVFIRFFTLMIWSKRNHTGHVFKR